MLASYYLGSGPAQTSAIPDNMWRTKAQPHLSYHRFTIFSIPIISIAHAVGIVASQSFKMTGSSRLPVSLHDTFNARKGSAKGQFIAMNMDV